MIRRVLIKILTILYTFFYSILPKSIIDLVHRITILEIEKRERIWITSHKRPKLACDVGTKSDRISNLPKTAIVIQGPLINEENFTLETIRLYKEIFSSEILIISTWLDEDNDNINKLREENIELILNEKPQYFGESNINLQIVSTSAGIERAHYLGCEYVLKTRSDQRIYNPNAIVFLNNMLNNFPLKSGSIQRNRIIGVSLNTFKYRLYGLSDMTTFGHIDDMLLYWNPPLDHRRFTLEQRADLASSIIKFSKDYRVCEVYLVTEFLKNINREIEWTLFDSWKVYSQYFCVVDKESIDLFWFKYSREREYRYTYYDSNRTDEELSFQEWFNLYTGLGNIKEIPEYILNLGFGSEID